MFAKTLLPVLAVIGAVVAQSSSGTATTNSACSQTATTLHSTADATALAQCTKFTGDVTIAPDAAGNWDISTIEEIDGDLSIKDAALLLGFVMEDLTTITGKFEMFNLTGLSNCQLPKLTSVKSIDWDTLPTLSEVMLTAGIESADSILVQNSFLSTLDNFNLTTVNTMNINNNYRLQTFISRVSNITGLLDIEAKGQDLAVSFPDLVWAANVTIRNASSLSIPSLVAVNGSFGLYDNSFLNLSLSNLTTVGGFTFDGNSAIVNLTIPVLSTCGALNQISNNSQLANISMPALTEIGGAIDWSGNFFTPLAPQLSDVKGGCNIQSTQPIDCTKFVALHNNKDIQGKFTCTTTANVKSADGSSTSSSSGSSTTSKGAAVSYGVNEALLGVSVVGGLLRMLL